MIVIGESYIVILCAGAAVAIVNGADVVALAFISLLGAVSLFNARRPEKEPTIEDALAARELRRKAARLATDQFLAQSDRREVMPTHDHTGS